MSTKPTYSHEQSGANENAQLQYCYRLNKLKIYKSYVGKKLHWGKKKKPIEPLARPALIFFFPRSQRRPFREFRTFTNGGGLASFLCSSWASGGNHHLPAQYRRVVLRAVSAKEAARGAPPKTQARKHCEVHRRGVPPRARVQTRRETRRAQGEQAGNGGAQPNRSLTRYMSFFLPL